MLVISNCFKIKKRTEQYQTSMSAIIVLSTALVTPLPALLPDNKQT